MVFTARWSLQLIPRRNAVLQRARVRHILVRHEQGAGHAAEGYARSTGLPGVALVTSGPGATNMVTPLTDALMDSIPLVCITGQVPTHLIGNDAFQECDTVGITRPCTKHNWLVRRIEDLPKVLHEAFYVATTGRPGPVVLLCPADMLREARAAANDRVANMGHFPLDRVSPDPDRIRQAAQLIAGARAPVVIAGGGVHLSDATAELAALQEAAHLPVGTTNMGKGSVDETHPLSLGVLANALGRGSPARHMRPFLDEADVVLLIGTRTNQNGTDSWKLYPRDARFIHIDIDGTEVGRNYEALRLVGDARLALRALTEALRAEDGAVRMSARAAVTHRIAEARQTGLAEAQAMRSGATPLRPERIMAELDTRLGPDTIVTADASYSSLWVNGFLTARAAGQRFVTPRGLAGLGWGLPLALGAKAAAPGSKVICVVGDGGFGHSWQELETARRMGLDIVVILLNNGILGFQKHAELVKFGAHTSAIDFTDVDHVAIARAAGCQGQRIERAEDIGPALDAALARSGTTLLDVVTDPEAHPPITVFQGHLGGD